MRGRSIDVTEPTRSIERAQSAKHEGQVQRLRTPEEDAAVRRTISLSDVDTKRIEHLMHRSIPVGATDEAVLKQWRSWELKVGRRVQDFSQEEARAYDDYRSMFALAHVRARQSPNRIDTRTVTLTHKERGPHLDTTRKREEDTEPMAGARPRIEQRQDPREPLPCDPRSRRLLRLEEREQWDLAMLWERRFDAAASSQPQYRDASERVFAANKAKLDRVPLESWQRELQRLDALGMQGRANDRDTQLARENAVLLGTYIRRRLDDRRDKEAALRSSARERINALDPQKKAAFEARLKEALGREEFRDAYYCRVEARRLAALPARNRAERERLLLVCAAAEVKTERFHQANWERDVRYGFGFARDQVRAKEVQLNLRRRDDELQLDAARHVSDGRDEAPLRQELTQKQAQYCLLEDSFERKRLEEAADELAARLHYIALERERRKEAEQTSPMRKQKGVATDA